MTLKETYEAFVTEVFRLKDWDISERDKLADELQKIVSKYVFGILEAYYIAQMYRDTKSINILDVIDSDAEYVIPIISILNYRIGQMQDVKTWKEFSEFVDEKKLDQENAQRKKEYEGSLFKILRTKKK